MTAQELVDKLKKKYPKDDISLEIAFRSWTTKQYALYISEQDCCHEYFSTKEELTSRIKELLL